MPPHLYSHNVLSSIVFPCRFPLLMTADIFSPFAFSRSRPSMRAWPDGYKCPYRLLQYFFPRCSDVSTTFTNGLAVVSYNRDWKCAHANRDEKPNKGLVVELSCQYTQASTRYYCTLDMRRCTHVPLLSLNSPTLFALS